MPVPDWLTPYVDDKDAVRASLTTPQQVLFDSLWARACGDAPPGLSNRERTRLLDILEGQ